MPPLVPLAGSVFSAGGYVPAAPRDSPKTWASMVNEKQKAALSTRLGIPIIYGIDANHGNCYVYKATIFPHNIGLGATRDPMLVKKIGEATALEVRAAGIPYVFAPSLAVCRDPRWGRCYESYGEDPKLVQSMTEFISGLQGDAPSNYTGRPYVAVGKKVAACARQYVGAGGTYNGIDQGNTVIDKNGMMSVHMRPYYSAILRGVSSFMVSYSSWNGVKTHANKFLITDYLKNSLKFRGFVISDWEGIDRITSPPHANYSSSIAAGVGAGIDMIMAPSKFTEFIDGLTSLVQNKVIPMSRIDDAVYRILRVKFTMGLFENPFADLSLAGNTGSWHAKPSGNPWCCLKNGKSAYTPLLPLRKKAGKILVAGRHADNLGYQCGGWTMSWQGQSGNNFTAGTTILSAIKATVDRSTQVVYSENPDASHVAGGKYDYAIVVVGDKPYAEELGDNPSLTIPAPGPSVIQTVCKSVKCVVVIVSGRPLVVEPYLGAMDALVAAWLPGTEGQGVADVLFGDYGFSGKLPRTWFRSVDQLPMNLGDKHYDPLFPVGFGLTTQARK
ncbi:hypothetical protein PR202_gn00904 [Eleusine coracana subsp. coracana]|uniref:Uncharacterized protein n=1 Tax=Eleusine coracana subsp. coracana TaxID=191504 RepID=A0AAV5G5N0_ELECO|nr:hypothetical protein PR202_gn00904 [Eleusine coracana subsp. coracana]